MLFVPLTCTNETLSDLDLIYGWSELMQLSFSEEINKADAKTPSVGETFRYWCDVDTAAEKEFLKRK